MTAARGVTAALTTGLLLAVLSPFSPAATASTSAAAEEAPKVSVAQKQGGEGSAVDVSGTGWRPKSVVTLLLCGQNALAGTEDCASAEGRAATADAKGEFRLKLPVAEPPEACPCVVRAVAVTGEHAAAQAAFKVDGHPVKALPKDRTGGERLSVLDARLEGSDGVGNWFGSPPKRQLVLTVANQGSDPSRNPVFQVGTAQGVLAPDWADQQWRGTLAPGEQKQVKLDVELAAGAYGDYRVGVQYGQTVLAEQPWEVGRPWGLTLFWLLLLILVPLALFRVGQVVIARTRPHARRARERTTRPDSRLTRLRDRLEKWQEPADDGTGVASPRTKRSGRTKGPGLPWMSPDAAATPAGGDGPVGSQDPSEHHTAPETAKTAERTGTE